MTSDRDWVEDYPYENGNYLNECRVCKKNFIGHKRRVVCKVCSERPSVTPPYPLSSLPQADGDSGDLTLWPAWQRKETK